MPSSSPDPLEQLLKLSESTPPSPDITTEVWRRISRSDVNDETPSLGNIVHGWFGKWPFAALFVATCILTGLLLAEFRLNQLEDERQAQLARSYLTLIDPLLQEMEPGGSS